MYFFDVPDKSRGEKNLLFFQWFIDHIRKLKQQWKMKNIVIKGLKIQVYIKRYHFDTVFYYLFWFDKCEQILLPRDSLRHKKYATDRINFSAIS